MWKVARRYSRVLRELGVAALGDVVVVEAKAGTRGILPPFVRVAMSLEDLMVRFDLAWWHRLDRGCAELEHAGAAARAAARWFAPRRSAPELVRACGVCGRWNYHLATCARGSR